MVRSAGEAACLIRPKWTLALDSVELLMRQRIFAGIG